MAERLKPYKTNEWYPVRLDIDVAGQTFDLSISGQKALTAGKFHHPVESVERLEMRTGFYRRENQYPHVHDIRKTGPIYTDGDEKVAECVVYVDDLKIR